MVNTMTDFELATEIRVTVSKLNSLFDEALKRELIVQFHSPEIWRGHIDVDVLSEVS